MVEPRYLLDSNIGIYILKGTAARAARRLMETDRGAIITSSICLAEMLIGLRDDERLMLDVLLQQMPILPFDEMASRRYATLPFKRRGFDRLIAAHGLALDLTVITANLADFEDVPGLRVEDWMQP